MIPFTSNQRYFVYTGITDFRKGYDGLYGMIKTIMESNPLSGDVYVFLNRRHNQIRMLVYDRGGLVLLSKRLERGTFEILKTESTSNKISVNYTQLMCIMEGIKLQTIQFRKRYQLSENKVAISL